MGQFTNTPILQGFIHTNLVDIKTIKEQIKEIKTQLPIGLNVPVNIVNADVSELFKLISLNVVYIKDVLVFILEIPLVNSYEFMLYKPLPLPFKVKNDVYGIIEPSSDYIAIDKTRLYFINLSNQQLSKCKKNRQFNNMLS